MELLRTSVPIVLLIALFALGERVHEVAAFGWAVIGLSVGYALLKLLRPTSSAELDGRLRYVIAGIRIACGRFVGTHFFRGQHGTLFGALALLALVRLMAIVSRGNVPVDSRQAGR